MNDLKKFRDRNSEDKTDELGEAEFVVDACSSCDAILIQVWNNTFFSGLENESRTRSLDTRAKAVPEPDAVYG